MTSELQTPNKARFLKITVTWHDKEMLFVIIIIIMHIRMYYYCTNCQCGGEAPDCERVVNKVESQTWSQSEPRQLSVIAGGENQYPESRGPGETTLSVSNNTEISKWYSTTRINTRVYGRLAQTQTAVGNWIWNRKTTCNFPELSAATPNTARPARQDYSCRWLVTNSVSVCKWVWVCRP